MKKTGELLKKAREEKGLSLHEIGLSLKISSKVLKAIEEGDETQLPAKTFLRGFVQSYANFLHLNSDEVLEVFYEEMGSTKPKPYIRQTEETKPAGTSETEAKPATEGTTEAAAAAPAPEATVTPIRRTPPPTSSNHGMQSLKENKNTKTYIILGLGIVLVGLILFTKKMIDKYSKEAEVPSAEVAQTMEGATPVVVDTSIDGGTLTEVEPNTTPGPLGNLTTTPTPTAPVSSTAATAASPTAAVSTPVTTPTPAVSPTPTPKPTTTPSPTPTATPSPTPVASPSPTPTPTPSPKPESGKPVELIVEALDSVEIEYSAPNGKPQKIRLSAEQVHTFKSKSGLKINFSNGGAVNLILNGKEIGIPGDLGKPIRLSY
ncbi:helix-turn-helix domain-containing protein [Bdellovibrio bacteriovorus]|uniref:helix-turn-helix domain-containing protein n=1 Tax=Bdellovibrio bacteriovorus TaxID=959 RepID=UPI003AA84732